jgi:hypothetical protein
LYVLRPYRKEMIFPSMRHLPVTTPRLPGYHK